MPQPRLTTEGLVSCTSPKNDRLTCRLDLPAPPSVNALWRNVQGIGRARTPRYRAWATDAGWQLRAQRPPLISGPVEVPLAVGTPKRPRDLDGYFKGVLDLLESGNVLTNDSQVKILHGAFDAGVETGRVHVTVEAMPNE